MSKIKVQNQEKYEYAYLLFMQRVSQVDICERVGISAPTLQKWKDSGGWEAKRAVKLISVDELVAKTLNKINMMLDNPEFNADAFSKAVAQLKSLKVDNTVDEEIMTFLDFQNWLLQNKQLAEITNNFLQCLIKLQDLYIQYRLGNGKK